jgi:hypothetical protein
MRTRSASVMFVSLTLALAAGCNVSIAGPTVIGSGHSASEDRSVSDFHGLNVATAILATVSIGTPQRVTVTADDNVLSMVKTNVSNGELQVSVQGSVTVRTPIQVNIVVPALDSLTATSAARIEAAGVSADALSVEVNSAGVINASGQATSLNVTAESSGTANLDAVPVQDVTADIASAGRVTVSATGSVGGKVQSAGLLTIHGNPTQVDVETDAAGRVVRE